MKKYSLGLLFFLSFLIILGIVYVCTVSSDKNTITIDTTEIISYYNVDPQDRLAKSIALLQFSQVTPYVIHAILNKNHCTIDVVMESANSGSDEISSILFIELSDNTVNPSSLTAPARKTFDFLVNDKGDKFVFTKKLQFKTKIDYYPERTRFGWKLNINKSLQKELDSIRNNHLLIIQSSTSSLLMTIEHESTFNQ